MSMSFRVAALPVILTTALSACGGGGSGGGVREVPFTSFSAVGPDEAVVMSGISQTASGTVDGDTGGLTAVLPNLPDSANSTARLTYDGSRNLTGLAFSTPQSSVSLGNASCGSGICTAENATSAAIATDALALGWNYQSYGVWLSEASPTSLHFGAMSAGLATPASAVPTSGNANFNGSTSALYVDAAGVPFFTSAVMNAAVNFGAQSIAFTSTQTRAGNLLDGSSGARPDLNLSGNLSYTQGTNRFSGTLSTTSNPSFLTGQGTGRFYGPAAQEIGGTYNLSGTGGHMLGGFGGKR